MNLYEYNSWTYEVINKFNFVISSKQIWFFDDFPWNSFLHFSLSIISHSPFIQFYRLLYPLPDISLYGASYSPLDKRVKLWWSFYVFTIDFLQIRSNLKKPIKFQQSSWKGYKMDFKGFYICHTPYLRKSKAYDHDFWCTCVKWWYLQAFFSFLALFGGGWGEGGRRGGGVKGKNLAQNKK